MARTTPGTTISAETRAARKKWTDTNPLRAWRLGHDPRLTILEAAQLIGVGMSMVQMYEKGVHKPGPNKADRMAELLGSDWSDRWDRWLAAQPT